MLTYVISRSRFELENYNYNEEDNNDYGDSGGDGYHLKTLK